jgi:glyceraldehyde 3-phosphate dehydrogenase
MRFRPEVEKDAAGNITKNELIFKGKNIPVLGKKDPNDLKWGEYKVDIVLECTGRLKSKADGQVHLDNGAKGVIISAPSSDKDIPTFVYGVNTNKLDASMKDLGRFLHHQLLSSGHEGSA